MRRKQSMKLRSILIVLLLFLIHSVLLADGPDVIDTGFDLYQRLKLGDNPQSEAALQKAMNAIGYLDGCLNGYKLGEFVMLTQCH